MKLVTLTKDQRRAVELGNGAHLITAPPGSGKTEVLVRRVIRLVGQSSGDLFRILALTYTRKAAEELKERVQQTISERDRWRINATTFHSFALEILQNYGKAIGLKNPITVISDLEDKRLLVTPLLEDIIGPVNSIDRNQWKSLFDEIALRKTNLETPDQVDGDRVLNGWISLSDAYEAYETALLNAGCVDYEGMICQAIKLFRIDPWVRSHTRRLYHHTLVDEGQELTRGQYELLKAIHDDNRRNFFVVADIDQSINSFAGGGPEYLHKYVREFNADEKQLTTNFRSAGAIVDILHLLQANMETGRLPQFVPSSASRDALADGWVGARSYADGEKEAAAVIKWIKTILADGLDPGWVYEGESTDVQPEDICLLGRTGYALSDIAAELNNHDIPVILSTEQGALFESRLGRAGYYALKLAENPGDLPAQHKLFKELNNVEAMESGYLNDPKKIWTLLRTQANNGTLHKEFVDALSYSNGEPNRDLEAVRKLIELELDLGDENETIAWQNDQQLLTRLLNDHETGTSALNRSLAGFLGMIYQIEQAPSSEPGVRALTPHKARGLGFKAVVVLGMREGNFPHYKADTQKELDEERRVVYVAASRAARALLFTRSRRRTSYGRYYHCKESRFISEMGLVMEDL